MNASGSLTHALFDRISPQFPLKSQRDTAYLVKVSNLECAGMYDGLKFKQAETIR